MEILDNIAMPGSVHFHKKGAGTTYFKVSADKSECKKIKSSNKCLDCIPNVITLRHVFLVRFRTF